MATTMASPKIEIYGVWTWNRSGGWSRVESCDRRYSKMTLDELKSCRWDSLMISTSAGTFYSTGALNNPMCETD